MALLATSRSGKRRRCTSSVFKVAMKLSAMALCPGRSRSFPSKERYRPPRGACRTRSPCTWRRDRNDVRAHRPTDDPSGVGVQDEGQLEEAFLSRYVGDVRQSDPVRTTGNEVPAKQVRCGSGPRITAGGCAPLTPYTASKPCGLH